MSNGLPKHDDCVYIPLRTYLSAIPADSLGLSAAAQSVPITVTEAMTAHSSEPAQLPTATAGRGASVVPLHQATIHHARLVMYLQFPSKFLEGNKFGGKFSLHFCGSEFNIKFHDRIQLKVMACLC